MASSSLMLPATGGRGICTESMLPVPPPCFHAFMSWLAMRCLVGLPPALLLLNNRFAAVCSSCGVGGCF